MDKQTGGPAFPMADPFVAKFPKNEAEAQRLAEGMSLRDYFAAKAMQGITTDPSLVTYEDLANEAYKIADALLKARNQ